jgi:hypothetical protein
VKWAFRQLGYTEITEWAVLIAEIIGPGGWKQFDRRGQSEAGILTDGLEASCAKGELTRPLGKYMGTLLEQK